MNLRRRRFSPITTAVAVAATVTVTIAGVLAASPLAARAAATPVAPGTRAMWLWSDAPSEEVVAWAAGHGVTEIMAHVPADPTAADVQRLRVLRERAASAGIGLSALGGDHAWTFDHAAALDWHRDVTGTGLFSTVHLDVEPYLLPQWNSDRTATALAYLELLDKLGAPGALRLEADIPFWYGGITVSGANLATEVLRRVAAVTVMTYRDTATGPNSMMDVATDMLERGSLAGKPVRLAAETQPLADCTHCTFAEEGAGTGAGGMAAVLSTVDGLAAGYPAFAGIAIHHYDSWRGLAG
jgi:hypothetical protein